MSNHVCGIRGGSRAGVGLFEVERDGEESEVAGGVRCRPWSHRGYLLPNATVDVLEDEVWLAGGLGLVYAVRSQHLPVATAA